MGWIRGLLQWATKREVRTAKPRRRGRGFGDRHRLLRCETLESRELLSITAADQALIYLLNVARHNPAAYQQQQNLPVDLSSVAAQPPLAVDDKLVASAYFHANEMATYNYFGHQSQVTGEWPNKMERDQGYALPYTIPTGSGGSYWTLPDNSNQIESIAAGFSTAQATLNGLLVDAGENPPGHRIHLLGMDSFNALWKEVGAGTAYNASSTYGNYWGIHTGLLSTSDEFLTGVVYSDANGNHSYDQGEGLAGVTITANGLTTTTNAAGGWSIPVTNGTYTVTASGGSFSGVGSVPVVVSGSNVEADFISGLATGYVNFSLVKPAPAFSSLSGPSIASGTAATTVSGAISLVPNGETVSITVNGVAHTATVTNGAFSSSFSTSVLTAAGSPYTISYAYAGDTNLGSASATSSLYVDRLPSVTTPVGAQAGNVTISYSLYDALSKACGIVVQYSANGGSTWSAATQGTGGNGTSNLAASPAGTPHTFVWNSTADIGGVSVSQAEIRIAQTTGSGTGSPVATGVFAVNNAGSAITVDDSNSGFSASGAWTASSQGLGGGARISSSTAGSVGSMATWTSTVQPGLYDVAVTWTAATNLSQNVVFIVYSIAGGVSAQLGFDYLNQRIAPNQFTDQGVNWSRIGTFQVTTGTQLQVLTANNQTDGQVCADAVRIAPVGAITINDADQGSQGCSTAGAWTTTNQGLYGASKISSSAAGSVSSVADWSVSVPPGLYDVAVTWTAGSNLSQDVIYQIYSCNNAAYNLAGFNYVNQRVAPNQFTDQAVAWNRLGTFRVNSGDNVLRVLTANARTDGQVCVDAVRITPVGSITVNDADSWLGSEGFSSAGTWAAASQGLYGGAQISSTTAGGSGSAAVWTATVQAGTTYSIAVTWTAGSNLTQNAVYYVFDSNNYTLLGSGAVNQQSTPADFTDQGVGWKGIGSFKAASNVLRVIVWNTASDGQVFADAVRLTPVG